MKHISHLILISKNNDILNKIILTFHVRLFERGSPWKVEKLRCILHYFRRVTEDSMLLFFPI
jgi:hypothetical protein